MKLVFAVLAATAIASSGCNESSLPLDVVTDGSVVAGRDAALPAPEDLSMAGGIDISHKDPWVLEFAVETLAAPMRSTAVGVADFNGDRLPDLAVAGETASISIFRNRLPAKPSFELLTVVPIADSLVSDIATADVNRDGLSDVVVLTNSAPALLILLGNGNGGFEVVRTPLSFNPAAVQLWDLDGDGRSDLVVSGVGQGMGEVALLRNEGGGRFSVAASQQAGQSAGRLALGDMNGDGKVDVVAIDASGSALMVLPGRGGLRLGPASSNALPDKPRAIQLGDFDGDALVDAVVVLERSNALGLARGDGTGGLAIAFTFATGARPVALGTADFNADALLDVVVANTSGGTVGIMVGTGGGQLAPQVPYDVSNGPWSLAVADLNLDGKPDVVTVGPTVARMSVVWNTSH